MKLVDHTITDFTDLLASDAPAPGGGSAAALEGALGVSLLHMVASLTKGRAKYQEHAELVEKILTESAALKARFIDIIDRDTEAFNAVGAVFQMPKDTEEQKAARKEAMQEALKGCTKTPYEMMVLAGAALELTDQAVGKTNANAASDLGVAAVSLKAAAQGAWLNILINIPGIQDQAFAEDYRLRGKALLEKSVPLADGIYERIARM